MASLGLTPDELKAVELSRQRLSQLSSSIGSLKADVFSSNPLPKLDSLQRSADILQNNLRSLVDIVTQHNDVFSRLTVHPSTNFPGRTQENILLQLLRKKPEPDVAAAMDEGRKTLDSLLSSSSSSSSSSSDGAKVGGAAAAAAEGAGTGGPEEQERMKQQQRKQKEAELQAVWDAARRACMVRVLEYAQNEDNDAFTAEERELGVENVRTGLRRKLDQASDSEEDLDEDSDDDDDDGDGMKGVTRTGQGQGQGGNGNGNDDDDDDLMVLDRPPPAAPAAAVVPGMTMGPAPGGDVEGVSLDNLMRFVSRGELIS